MHVVAVIFRMAPADRTQVIHINAGWPDVFEGDRIAHRDALIAGPSLITGRKRWRLFQRGRTGPDQFGGGRTSLDGGEETRKRRIIFLFTVLPAMHAIVEMNDVEVVLAQHHFNLAI